MCGGFNLTWKEWRQISDALCMQDHRDAGSYRHRFKIAPTDRHFIMTSKFEGI